MFAGSASGEILPPYVVYKAEHLWDTWTTGGPNGCRYNRTKSGWFDVMTFEDWFLSILLGKLRKLTGPKVLIGDNLSSHINPVVIRACEENNIKFVCLPPHSTHITQPLDVAFYGPMKRYWRSILNEWKLSGNMKAGIQKDQFPQLLKQLVEKINLSKENIISGFEKTGIAPVNRLKVLERLPNEEVDVELVGAAFLHGIAQKRANLTVKPKTTRKKLNVVPGKSFGLDDITPTEIESDLDPDDIVHPAAKKPRGRPKVIKSVASTSSSHEMDVLSCEPEATSTPKCKTKKKEIVISSSSEDTDDDYSLHDDSFGEDLQFSNDELDHMDTPDVQLSNTNDGNQVKKIVQHMEDSDSVSENVPENQAIQSKESCSGKSSFTEGEFVLVKYNGSQFPGIVVNIHDSGVKVDCMEQMKKFWVWPQKKDVFDYALEDVKKIAPPKLLNKRGYFSVPELSDYA